MYSEMTVDTALPEDKGIESSLMNGHLNCDQIREQQFPYVKESVQKLWSIDSKEQSLTKTIYCFSSLNKDLQLDLVLESGADFNKFLCSLWDVCYETDIFKFLVPKIILDQENACIKLIFPQNNLKASKKYIASIIRLMAKLREYNFKELHENDAALHFYMSSGQEILHVNNYPPLLVDFLMTEHNSFDSLLHEKKHTYTTLVEVGCGELENVQLAQKNQLKYIGIDFDPTRINTANQIIQRHGYQQVQVACADIINMKFFDLYQSQHDKPILIFPFNVFGNIAPISYLLAKLKLFSMDFIISSYKINTTTNNVREAYYRNCGYHDLQKIESSFGVTFKSKMGLHTIAYSQVYLCSLLQAFGFTVSVLEAEHGLMFVVNA